MDKKFMWAYFMQLSNHMHEDGGSQPNWYYRDDEYTPNNGIDFAVWDKLVDSAAEQGINTVVITIGDGVKYESHPEISAPDAISKLDFKAKLDKMRSLGITPIPKLNFSCAHQAWLKEYRRMVSSSIYRRVCVDLIEEMIELFDKPEYFHLGMDEEMSIGCQQTHEAIIMRGEKLMFEDFGLFFDTCKKHGARPWIWADYHWLRPEIFERRMPRDVLLSNWYYRTFPAAEDFYVGVINDYEKLDKLGFDQVPTCSTHSCRSNPFDTLTHCKKVISPSRLYGYMFAPWFDIKAKNDLILLDGIRRFSDVRGEIYPESL